MYVVFERVDEKSPSLLKTYKDKCTEYFSRAEYIKDHIKDREDPQPAGPADGGKHPGKGKG
jgi:hypothetical protein